MACTISGYLSTHSPTRKKVHLASYSSRMSRSLGVLSAPQLASKVTAITGSSRSTLYTGRIRLVASTLVAALSGGIMA